MKRYIFLSEKALLSLSENSSLFKTFEDSMVVVTDLKNENMAFLTNTIYISKFGKYLRSFYLNIWETTKSTELRILEFVKNRVKYMNELVDWVWIREPEDKITESLVENHSIRTDLVYSSEQIKTIASQKVVYICLPMSGQEDTISQRYHTAIDEVREIFPNALIVGPINIQDFDIDTKHKRQHPWTWYMGKDVERLLGCEVIYICDKWKQSRGCQVEVGVAKKYGIFKIEQNNFDKTLLENN